LHALKMSTTDEERRQVLANGKYDSVIQSLRDALENKAAIHEPWTSGVVTLPQSENTLFYEQQDGTPRFALSILSVGFVSHHGRAP